MKLFENKDLDPKTIIGFGILNGISIGLLNLSLGFNSIGFYQVGLLFRNQANLAFVYFSYFEMNIFIFSKRHLLETLKLKFLLEI